MRGALARATGSCGLQMRVIASASRRRIAGATNSLDAYSFGLHFSCLSSLFTLTVTGTMQCLSDCSRFPAILQSGEWQRNSEEKTFEPYSRTRLAMPPKLVQKGAR